MSTRIVLGGIGAAVGFVVGGGPQGAYWGWAIGSAAGSVIDPQVIRGPSLGDIAQQTSQEGGPIPIPFGLTPPITGNVIATSEPRIEKNRESGKGGPKVETESVFRTYGIGFAEGPVGAFVRVWRNNTKVYDILDPEFTEQREIPVFNTTLPSRNERFLERARFFLGTYDQAASPDLEAVFGAGTTPAHRGLAYMVMADDDLTDTRGMIPQWTVQIADVVEQSEIIATATSRVLRSVDGGITWSVETPASLSGVTLSSLSYSRTLGRIVGIQDGTHSPQIIRYSDDKGLTWSSAASPLPNGTFTMGEILRSDRIGLFVVSYGTDAASARIAMYSADGSTWTVTPTAALSINDFSGPVDTGTHIVIASSGRTFYSTDGINWSSNASATLNASGAAHHVGYSPDLDRMVAASGNMTPRYSSAFPWNSWTASGSGNSPSVAWCDHLQVFARGGFESPYTSPDGITWTTGAAQSGTSRSMVWMPMARRLVAVGSLPGPTAQIYTSEDGLTYTRRVNTGSYIVQDVIEVDYSVVATDGVPLTEIVTAICARAGLFESMIDVSQLDATAIVRGFIVTNQYPAGQAIAALGQIYLFDATKYDGLVRFVPRGLSAVRTVTSDDMVEGSASFESKRYDAINVPRSVHLSYHDVDTDALTPLKQTSERHGDRRAVGELSLQSAVVMDANLAAQSVSIAHAVMIEDQRGAMEFSLPDSFIDLVPSDPIIVQHDGISERGRIQRVDVDDGFQKYVVLRDRQRIYTLSVEGISPPVLPSPPSQVIGPTLLAVLDVPVLQDADDGVGLGYYAAIAGFTNGWAGALVELSYDGGANYIDSSQGFVAAIMGSLATGLADHPAEYPDETNTFSVQLAGPSDELEASTLAGMLNGANLAAIGNHDDGWELINFAQVEEVTDGQWQVGRLLRGRKHTATRAHVAGDLFVLLNRSLLALEPASMSDIGRTLTFRATSLGEAAGVTPSAQVVFAGRIQQEYPVGYIEAERDGANIVVTWQGAHRLGAGMSVADGLQFAGYRVTFSDGVDQIQVDTVAQMISQNVSSLTGTVTVSVVALNNLTGAGPATTVEVPP